jgi:hypothetical protein
LFVVWMRKQIKTYSKGLVWKFNCTKNSKLNKIIICLFINVKFCTFSKLLNWLNLFTLVYSIIIQHYIQENITLCILSNE